MADATPLPDPASPACAELLRSTHSQLRSIAASYFAGQPIGHTLQPTALLHEAVLKIINAAAANPDPQPGFSSREHFIATAANAMRQVLVDHARAKAALKRNGAPPQRDNSPAADASVTFIDLTGAIDRLMHADPRAGRAVMLRFFSGLTTRQIASLQGISDSTVESDWRAARAFLACALGARS